MECTSPAVIRLRRTERDGYTRNGPGQWWAMTKSTAAHARENNIYKRTDNLKHCSFIDQETRPIGMMMVRAVFASVLCAVTLAAIHPSRLPTSNTTQASQTEYQIRESTTATHKEPCNFTMPGDSQSGTHNDGQTDASEEVALPLGNQNESSSTSTDQNISQGTIDTLNGSETTSEESGSGANEEGALSGSETSDDASSNNQAPSTETVSEPIGSGADPSLQDSQAGSETPLDLSGEMQTGSEPPTGLAVDNGSGSDAPLDLSGGTQTGSEASVDPPIASDPVSAGPDSNSGSINDLVL